MSKIANTDKLAMNELYKMEASKRGIKLAAEDPQAFKDHADYLAVVESVLAADKKTGWDPNSPTLD